MSWKNVQRNTETGQYRTHEGSSSASALTDLTDVNVSSPSDGQVLKYDSTTQKWKNENESGGGSVNDVTLDGNSVVNGQGTAVLTTPNVNDLKDTNISSPSSGQTLQYNATSQKWENATPASGGNVDDVKVNGTSVVTNKVANIKSYKEVTQAEYEALPDTKLSDDVLYAIKDSQGAGGFPPLIYSDVEREVGVWRDGKPLYQKTVQVTTTLTSGDVDVPITTSNLETLVDAWATAKMGNGSWVQLSTSNPGTNWNLSIYDIDSSKVRFCVGSSIANRGFSEVYVTLQYTKTTDTAGSGTWNQQGAIAHHYSTSEKVIGTWIDGKPLYERVFDLGSAVTISSGWTKVLNDTNIIPIQCVGISDTSVASYPLTADTDNDGFYLSGGNVSINKFILQYTKTTD